MSIVTVRRDLTELARQGLLTRTHGGALVTEQVTADKANADRAVEHRAEKKRIAAAAAKMVVAGDTVIIDAGTTSNEVARLLARRRDLTLITNSLDVATILSTSPDNRLYVVGGEFMPVNHSFAGSMAADMVRSFSVDKAFLSVSSIDMERGVIGIASPQSACVQQAMIEVAKIVVVVADHSKFNRTALSIVCPLKDIDCIVTDNSVSDRDAARVREHGSQLIRARASWLLVANSGSGRAALASTAVRRRGRDSRGTAARAARPAP